MIRQTSIRRILFGYIDLVNRFILIMPDGRKNNKGVKGNKGGRPSKAEEIKLLETMQSVVPLKTILERLNNLIETTDDDKVKLEAIKAWLDRMLGKPKERIEAENTNTTEISIPITEWIDE